MDRKPPRPMTLFDDMVTPPHLYTLKLMLPYTPSSNQRFLAMYIKFLELRYTMDHFYGFSFVNRDKGGSSSFDMFTDLMPYMSPEDKERMEQMESMMHMMELFQGMTKDGDMDGSSGSFNPMDMMMGMMDPKQQEMFNMYSSMFDDDLKNASGENSAASHQDPASPNAVHNNKKEGDS